MVADHPGAGVTQAATLSDPVELLLRADGSGGAVMVTMPTQLKSLKPCQ